MSTLAPVSPGTAVGKGGYLRFELLRILRNRRFLIFALGFPVVLYFLIAGPNRSVDDFLGTGLSAPLYYMVSLTAFGAMSGMLSTGTRIAAERDNGWNRLLRTTPLSPRSYLTAKVATAYLTVLLTMALLYISGVAMGVRLTALDWVEMTLLILVGLIPFAALGVLIGHLLTADTVGPAMGGLTAVLAFAGGTWFPVGHGTFYQIARLLPSYWLVQASHVALGGVGWSAFGWAVMAFWSVVLSVLAARAYLRDTRRT
jgi:ABC-2 type transport system permease protein